MFLMNRNIWRFIVNVIYLYYKFMLFLIIILMLVNYLKIQKQNNKQTRKVSELEEQLGIVSLEILYYSFVINGFSL